MSWSVDVCGILGRAGADADAPEGSQAWALAQVDAAVAELIEAADAYRRGGYHDPEVEFSAQYRARREGETSRLDAALARCRGEA